MAATPARYAAASAAYTVLRTGWGRSEAYADLATQAPPAVITAPRWGARVPARGLAQSLMLVPARVRHGRPWRLVLRVLAAAVLGVAAARSEAGGPAAAGMVTGLGMWLILTARGDLAPPPGR